MDSFGAIRALAREKHGVLRPKAGGNTATQLLAAAREATGLKVHRLPPDHPLLADGDGALRRASNAIYISNALSPDMAAYVEAHEFGHFWIETPLGPCGRTSRFGPRRPGGRNAAWPQARRSVQPRRTARGKWRRFIHAGVASRERQHSPLDEPAQPTRS
jgi:hypothetical protein